VTKTTPLVFLTLRLALGVSFIACLFLIGARALGVYLPSGHLLVYSSIELWHSQQPYVIFLADTERNLSSQIRLQDISNDLTLTCSSNGRIAGTTTLSESRNIFVTDMISHRTVQLTHEFDSDIQLSWSPDGKRLAIVASSQGGPNEIYITDFGDATPQKITNGAIVIGQPIWSPDGSQILFSAFRNSEYRQLYVVTLDTLEQRQLTDSEFNKAYPSWSPDGSRIAFASLSDDNFELYMMDREGENLQRLTETETNESYPVWSPDGTFIAYWSSGSDIMNDTHLYVMNADGTNQRRLAASVPINFGPVWSADSRWIAFNGRDHAVFLTSLDSLTPWQVSRFGERYALSPSWCS
jgi:TolB protein